MEALRRAPAEYGETGLKTFMVSYTGVVYEKDLGPDTLEEFREKMERFNPDKSWTPVATVVRGGGPRADCRAADGS